MKIAHYVGDHKGDGLAAQAGWALIRAVQRGGFRAVTHVEAILAEHAEGDVTIASSSLRDGGVRAKRVRLTDGHWLIVDVPQWDVGAALGLLQATRGMPYDTMGAVATVLPTRQDRGRYFCNEWVGTPFLHSPHIFGPAQFAAITASLGTDVTATFFGDRWIASGGRA